MDGAETLNVSFDVIKGVLVKAVGEPSEFESEKHDPDFVGGVLSSGDSFPYFGDSGEID